MARPSLTPEQLLAQYPPPVAEMAQTLRAFIRMTLPDAKEVAYPGWRAVGYRDAEAGYLGGIFLFEDHVRVLFEHGHLLPDPDGLLEGRTKQTRYIDLAPGDPPPLEGLATLLDAAVAVGRELRRKHMARP